MRSKQPLTAEQEVLIKERQRTLFFLWSGLSVSTLVYGWVAYMSRVKVSLFDENLVFFFQLLMGGAFLLGSLNYRKLTRSLAAPRKGVSFKEGMVQLTNRLIISWVLFESIVVLGLVLFFLGLPLQEFYVYLGLSMLSLLAHPPRASFLRAVAEGTQAQEA